MRDLRIDFLRGLALLMISIDHAPTNPLMLFTLGGWSFADAAELFFFLSGFVAALVYGRSLEKKGLKAAALRIWRRARTLYLVQLGLLLALVLAGMAYLQLSGDADVIKELRLDHFLAHPLKALMMAMALRYQPTYLDILPVYIVFFLVLPVILLMLQRRVWLTLGLSFALYLGVQIRGWTLTTVPDGSAWFFDPLAWQFLFILGAAFGSGRMARILPWLKTRPIMAAATVIVGVTALIVGSENWHQFISSIPAVWDGDLPTAKDTLAGLRLVSFLALALLAWQVLPSSASIERFRLGRAVVRCGQHSLSIFAAGVVLAALQSMTMGNWQSQLALGAGTAVGLVSLLVLADLLARRANGWRPFARLRETTDSQAA